MGGMLYEIAMYLVAILGFILILEIFSGILVSEMKPPYKKKFKRIWYISSLIVIAVFTLLYFLF